MSRRSPSRPDSWNVSLSSGQSPEIVCMKTDEGRASAEESRNLLDGIILPRTTPAKSGVMHSTSSMPRERSHNAASSIVATPRVESTGIIRAGIHWSFLSLGHDVHRPPACDADLPPPAAARKWPCHHPSLKMICEQRPDCPATGPRLLTGRQDGQRRAVSQNFGSFRCEAGRATGQVKAPSRRHRSLPAPVWRSIPRAGAGARNQLRCGPRRRVHARMLPWSRFEPANAPFEQPACVVRARTSTNRPWPKGTMIELLDSDPERSRQQPKP